MQLIGVYHADIKNYLFKTNTHREICGGCGPSIFLDGEILSSLLAISFPNVYFLTCV